jgi:apolipoprotein N-acyltransferase
LKNRQAPSFRQPLFAALASAVLLVLSFPRFNQAWCAWVALVPWLVALGGMRPRQAFASSYVVGLVFFLSSMSWLAHLTRFGGAAAVLGEIVLCLYLALYFGCFGWIAGFCSAQRHETRGQRRDRRFWLSCLASPVLRLLWVPSAWVAMEFLRSHLLSGFGWNLLGYSQTPALTAIQLADVTGVWGVSFVIVMVNVAMAQYLTERNVRRAVPTVLMAVGVVLASWLYGRFRLAQAEPAERVRVAVVQGNVPQEEKWDEAFQEAILERYERLTRQAAHHAPQLIVWPETSVPAVLGFDRNVTARVAQLAQSASTPLLVGAAMVRLSDDLPRLTNSAALLDQDGAIVARYDKLRLVPFGEFVPFETVIPRLRELLPPIGDFVPGDEYTVFQLPVTNYQLPAFSVLICFEDIFLDLARQFVRRGARMLVTITNDAWFGKSAAAYQHAQASTLRAVELRVPMVRAANTGWSGCIDAKGRWRASVRDADADELFVEGTETCDLAIGDTDTLYRRWGDWFAWLCVLACLGWAGFAIITR